MKKGFIEIFRYYSSGIGLIYIVYLLFGHSDNNTLSPYHYAILLFYFGNIIWLFSALNTYFLKGKKTTQLRTKMLLVFSTLFCFTLWMYFLTQK